MPDVRSPSAPTAGIRVPPPIIYAVPLVVGLLIHRWHPIRILPIGLGAPIGIGALLLGMVGFSAVLSFRRAKTSPKPWKPTTALVTDGPYRLTRNPMYLGFTLLYLGIAFWVNSVWPVFSLPLILVVMQRAVIAREEAYLATLFGDEYRAYRRRVRRWI